MDGQAFNLKNWTIKAQDRKRERMKFQVKLNKEETLAFQNFKNVVQPAEISDDDFFRAIFLNGIEAMQKKLMEEMEKFAEEHPEILKESEEASEEVTESADTSSSVEIIE